MKKLSALVFALAAFVFWAFVRPEWLNFHEQYQLFQFSTEYLTDYLALPGGMAVYASEFLVQFFYNTYLGAFVVAAVLCGIAILIEKIVERIL